MAGLVIKTGSRHIVHKVVVDEATLDRVAAALGIPAAERRQFISETESIHVYRNTRGSGGGTQTGQGAPGSSGGARGSARSGGRGRPSTASGTARSNRTGARRPRSE